MANWLTLRTVEEQAAQLLYSIIKGHAFSDGNKRIGSFIFVWFLEQNNFSLKFNKERKINDNTLVKWGTNIQNKYLPINKIENLLFVIPEVNNY